MPSSPILVEDNELDALLSKNALDPTTFAANQAVRQLHFIRDKRGNLLVLATVGVNPNTSPIQAGVTGNSNVAVNDSGFVRVAGVRTLPNWLVTDAALAVNPPQSAYQLYSTTDATTATFTTPTINPLVYRAVWIHVNQGTLTGTSSTLSINAIDPFTADAVAVQGSLIGAADVAVSQGLGASSKHDFLWGSFGPLENTTATPTLHEPVASDSTIFGPLLPFQIVLTKVAVTVYSCRISVLGLL